MAEKKQPARDNFIAKIVKDPKQVPDTLLLTGYPGESSEANHTRLYFDPQLSRYVDIADDDVLHTQDLPAGDTGLGAVYVWIKKDAILIHGKQASSPTRAKFLEGPIVKEFAQAQAPAAAPQGPGGGDDGGIDNTVAFCPITFEGSPCGYTAYPIVCTLTQPTNRQLCPTQQAFCPTAFPCPKFTVQVYCPTHQAPYICHTQVCVAYPVQAQPAVQPIAQPGAAYQQMAAQAAPAMAVTVGHVNCPSVLYPCVSHFGVCNQPTYFHPCPTLYHPECPVVTRVNCPVTHPPVCYYPTPTAHVTIVGCPIPTGNCPSIGGCPSIACGGGIGGNPAA